MAIKISIIIPTYNVELFINRCLDSIFNQSYGNFEVIMVDDGSTDATVNNAIKKYSSEPRLKIVKKHNGGQSSARNVGLKKATGQYVMFVDGDDWIKVNSLETLVNKLYENNMPDILEYGYEMTDGVSIFRKVSFKCECFEEDMMLHEFFYGNRITDVVWNKLFKRNLFSDICFDEGEIHEDYRIMPKILSKARRLCNVEYDAYYYYKRDGSTMQEKFSPKTFKRIAACEYVANYCKNDDYLKDYYIAARIRLCFACIYLFCKLKEDGGAIIYEKKIRDSFDKNYKEIKNNSEIRFLPLRKRIFLRMFMLNKPLTAFLYSQYRKGE